MLINREVVDALSLIVHKEKSYERGRKICEKLKKEIQVNEQAIYDALNNDFKKSEFEAFMSEFGLVISEINLVIKNLKKWSKPEQVSKEIDQQLKTELKKADAILNPDLFHRREKSVEKLTKNEITKSDLEKNNPLDFTKKDSHSFSEWLKLTTAKPIVREETKNLSNSKKPNSDLINKFIQENPKLKPSKSIVKYDNKENLSSQITYTSEALMTETLAKVYLQQNNYQKALQAYKILSLKYPEKSGFFADQIRAINKHINKI